MDVGPSAAPIIAIDAASLRLNPKSVAMHKVKKIPNCAAAPNIINTFVKQYDLSGKKIVLFATSGGSNIGKTAEKLKPYLSAGAEIAGAEVLNQNPSLEELKQWAVW